MPIQPIINAMQEGVTTVFVSGRSFSDLHLDENGKIRPIHSTLARRMWTEHQRVLVRCSLALGPVPELWPLDAAQRRQFESEARTAGANVLLPNSGGPTAQRYPHERALELLRMLHTATIEGRTLPGVFILFEFSEDLMPRERHSETSVQFSELVCLLASDFRLRGQKIFIAFHGIDQRMDERVLRTLPHLQIPQPGIEEKQTFIKALLNSELRSGARLEENLDESGVANLSAGTPNLGLEQVALASARSGQPVTHEILVRQKRDDLLRLSQGTLTFLDTRRVRGVQLVGRNVRRARELLLAWSDMLKHGLPVTPAAVLLAGGPSSGKSDHAWAEVINVRGESMHRTCEALEKAGLHADAERLKAVSRKNSEAWEAYARSAFDACARYIPRKKLRFLQYPTAETMEWWADRRDHGAILLGKAAEIVKLTAAHPYWLAEANA